MFSFHKPRVYRSTEGCCICRAKSSSSRFTDSRKYEQDSMKCFDLKYPRHGEICNACVLLVKRFKRLPVGSNRHWGHVVDARAGPGTKSISKQKKNRDDTENTSQNTSNNNTTNSRRTQSSKSLISEKFTKIFKKSKKSKIVTELADEHKIDASAGRLRNSVTGSQTWSDQHLSTHDSMDSDYEDITDGNAIDGGGGGGGVSEVVKRSNTNNNTIVQFQTQTRASAYRASHKSTTLAVSGSSASNNSHAGRRKHPLKTGTKRRKFMPPIRNRTTLKLLNDNAQFYDEMEWEERKSCCGKIYICPSLVGTILLDMDNFKLCTEHQRSSKQQQQQKQPVATQTQQKTIIATLPAVVQISAPTTPLATAPHLLQTPTVAGAAAAAINSNPTPVLKKHHLFFKRQSECFPQLDLCTNNNSNSLNLTSNKTDSSVAATNTPMIIKSNNNASNRSTITSTQHQTTSLSILNGNNNNNNISATLPLAINTTTSISAISSSISPSSNAAGISAHHSMQLPRHSTAKVTTISPPLPTTTATNLTTNNRLLHKIRTGKIFKHSLDKIGVMPAVSGAVSPTAIERIKTGDLPEVKPIMRGVPKSYVLSKPTTNGVGAGVINNNQHPTTTQYYAPGSSPTSTCSNSSAISTASSSSAAPKFSDNSSDSGFDENLQDRKSASPLQEDTEKKMATRATTGNVHTMFLASGVQIQGQHQNLMLTGNEIAAKLLHNRKQQMSMLAAAAASASNNGGLHQHYQQHQTPNNNLAASRIGTATQSLKISQVTPTTVSTVPIGGNSSGNSNNLGSHIKATMSGASTTQSTRAIYNNNTIQHENGVTTIVPASSLAASSQTAAMNALAPSTVTITPAPSHHMSSGGATTANGAISLTKKLTTTGLGVNLITTGSNNQSNILHTVANSSHLMNHSNNSALIQQHHNHQQQQQQQQQHTQHQHLHHHHHNTATNLNQKIILLKTTGPTKYNSTLGNMNGANNANNIKMTNGSTAGINMSSVNTGVCKN